MVMVGGSTRIPRCAPPSRRSSDRARTPISIRTKSSRSARRFRPASLRATSRINLLLDVTPLSLGIETMGGIVSKLIHRNSTIPASATEHFTTAVDGQRNVLIHVVQGERELVKDYRSLARFDLTGIDPVPAGLARIEVRFLIDANGILNVTARDLRTGKEQSVEVKPSYGLTDDQVEAMILEVLRESRRGFSSERQLREARVEADAILAAIEKARQSDSYFSIDRPGARGDHTGDERSAGGLPCTMIIC